MRTNRFSLIVVGTLCLPIFGFGCSGGSSSPTEPEPPPQQFRKVGNAEESVPVNADWTGQVAGCESAVTWRGGGVDIPTGVGNTFVTYWKSVGTKYPKAACLGVVDKVEFEVEVTDSSSGGGFGTCTMDTEPCFRILSVDRCGVMDDRAAPGGRATPTPVVFGYCIDSARLTPDTDFTAVHVDEDGNPFGGTSGFLGELVAGCNEISKEISGPDEPRESERIRSWFEDGNEVFDGPRDWDCPRGWK